MAGDWQAYQDYISGSFGELSVAKETYVKGQTGWFSCRSACYLATGRPVVTQDTGWSRFYPTGCGLFAYKSTGEAAAALEAVAADPAAHSRCARRIAEDCFDSRRVLTDLLESLGGQSFE